MRIERFKCIADYISSMTGFSVSEASARKWSARLVDPLPVVAFAGRVAADKTELDAWIERQWDRRRVQRRRANRSANGSDRAVQPLRPV